MSIAPRTWSADAVILGERPCMQAERAEHPRRTGEPFSETISVGIAAYPEHGATVPDLLATRRRSSLCFQSIGA